MAGFPEGGACFISSQVRLGSLGVGCDSLDLDSGAAAGRIRSQPEIAGREVSNSRIPVGEIVVELDTVAQGNLVGEDVVYRFTARLVFLVVRTPIPEAVSVADYRIVVH